MSDSSKPTYTTEQLVEYRDRAWHSPFNHRTVAALAAQCLRAEAELKERTGGELWSKIRSGLGYVRDDMKLAVNVTKYEEESAYFDIMARSLADTVDRLTKLEIDPAARAAGLALRELEQRAHGVDAEVRR